MRKVLVAVDGSECGFRAAGYAGAQFSGLTDLSVTLLHVLPHLPPRFWDNGHILSERERKARQEVVAKWLENQKLIIAPIFRRSVEILTEKGIHPSQVETKTIYDSTDIAGSIVEEARQGGYLTLVIGRCGFSRLTEFLLGSTASRIVNRGAGLAVCLVE